MAIELQDHQQYTLRARPKNARGLARIGDMLLWTVDTQGVVRLLPSPDALSCLVMALVPGAVTVTVSNEHGVSKSTQIMVTASPTIEIELEEGEPELQSDVAIPPRD
jgi:hypothetical protein